MRSSGLHGISKRRRNRDGSRGSAAAYTAFSQADREVPSSSEEEASSYEPSEDCDVCYLDGSSELSEDGSEDSVDGSSMDSAGEMGASDRPVVELEHPPEPDVPLRQPQAPPGVLRERGGSAK